MTTSSQTGLTRAEQEAELRKPFPPEAIKSRSMGGQTFKYVTISEVIAKLNRVLGTGNWSVVELDAWRDKDNPEWVIGKARVDLTFADGVTKTCISFGGTQVSKKRNSDDLLNLGDEFKGAASDAIKKAVTQAGVALELSRDDEMIQYDEDLANAASEAELDTLRAAIANLSDDKRKEFGAWWKKEIGRKHIDSGRVTHDDVNKIKEYLGV